MAGRRAQLIRMGMGNWITDFFYNAATGNLTEAQKNAIIAAQTQSMIRAGAQPVAAAAQSTADVNDALNTFRAPGAFGYTWTGAQPGGANWIDQAEQDLATSWVGQNWIWLALGGVGLLYLSRKI